MAATSEKSADDVMRTALMKHSPAELAEIVMRSVGDSPDTEKQKDALVRVIVARLQAYLRQRRGSQTRLEYKHLQELSLARIAADEFYVDALHDLDLIGKAIALLLFPGARMDAKGGGDGTGNGSDGVTVSGRRLECKTVSPGADTQWRVAAGAHSPAPFTWVLVLWRHKMGQRDGAIPLREILRDYVKWVVVVRNEYLQADGYDPKETFSVSPARWIVKTREWRESGKPDDPETRFSKMSKQTEKGPVEGHSPAPHRKLLWAPIDAWIYINKRMDGTPTFDEDMAAWQMLCAEASRLAALK